MVSAGKQSQPFVGVMLEHLRKSCVEVVVSCGDMDLSNQIPGNLSAFIPVIDRNFSPRQEAEANAAMAASRDDPNRLRLVPINLRPNLHTYDEWGVLRQLAEWVWLSAQDSLEWEAVLEQLVGVLKRPRRRCVWTPAAKVQRVFISYSFRNHDLAAGLADRFKGKRLDVFLADEMTLLNSVLRQELTHVIEECDVFVAVITAEYRGSNWSFVESEVALERFHGTGKPGIYLFAPSGERIPRWYEGFPVHHDFEELWMGLTTNLVL
jgi:hypothetical protein